MKPLVIYHKGCLDGAAAALAAWLRFGEEAEYRPASYGDPAPTDDEVRGRDVYVLDFSYPRAELVRISAVQYEYTKESPARYWGHTYLIDHHKTAEADLADLVVAPGARPIDVTAGWPIVHLNMSKSGAVLAWEHFHPPPMSLGNTRRLPVVIPELFAYVQDRDLWRWELPHSREVSAALGASGALTDFRKLEPYLNWKGTGDGHRTLWTKCVDDGAAILRAERLMVERVVATAEEVELSYLTNFGSQRSRVCISALAACSSVLQSDVGEALALESARRGFDAVGVVYYKDGPSGKWRMSLRSTGDNDGVENPRPAPDVSAIAKAFGGGGHHRAAGFECDRLLWENGIDVKCPHGVAINRVRCLKCADLDINDPGCGNRRE